VKRGTQREIILTATVDAALRTTESANLSVMASSREDNRGKFEIYRIIEAGKKDRQKVVSVV
jgi:hypothetical protein